MIQYTENYTNKHSKILKRPTCRPYHVCLASVTIKVPTKDTLYYSHHTFYTTILVGESASLLRLNVLSILFCTHCKNVIQNVAGLSYVVSHLSVKAYYLGSNVHK